MDRNTRLLSYRTLRDRADAVRESIWRRAQAHTIAAGLDCAGTIHNAIVSRDNQKPWRGVDYDHADKAQALFGRQFCAHRWLSRLVERRGYSAFTWDS